MRLQLFTFFLLLIYISFFFQTVRTIQMEYVIEVSCVMELPYVNIILRSGCNLKPNESDIPNEIKPAISYLCTQLPISFPMWKSTVKGLKLATIVSCVYLSSGILLQQNTSTCYIQHVSRTRVSMWSENLFNQHHSI